MRDITEPADWTDPHEVGDRVDVTICGAVLVHQGDHHVTLALDGVDDPINVPICADDGGWLRTVTVAAAVPEVRKGQVWRSVRDGFLFFATQPIDVVDGQRADGPVQFIMPNNEGKTPAQVVDIWGKLELLAEEGPAGPGECDSTPGQGPTADAIPVEAAGVRLGDKIFTPDHRVQWQTVDSIEKPANEAPGLVRLYTDHEYLGLLYKATDMMWVLAPAATADVVNPLDEWPQPTEPDDATWDGYLRPLGEPQPGDKDLTASPAQGVAVPLALEPSAAGEAATAILPRITDAGPAT